MTHRSPRTRSIGALLTDMLHYFAVRPCLCPNYQCQEAGRSPQALIAGMQIVMGYLNGDFQEQGRALRPINVEMHAAIP